jgi:amino acid transporter
MTMKVIVSANKYHSDFTWFESFAVSYTQLALVPSVASTSYSNVGVAGQAGSVWRWIVVGILIQSVVFGMAELCSSIPSAGGLYYASAVLAPEGWGPFASWVSPLVLGDKIHKANIIAVRWMVKLLW